MELGTAPVQAPVGRRDRGVGIPVRQCWVGLAGPDRTPCYVPDVVPWIVLIACSDGETVSPEELTGLRLEPAEATLTVREGEPAEEVLDRFRRGEPAETTFVAYAQLGDGREAVVDEVSWEASNLSAGTIDTEGRYRTVDTHGGISTITASHLGVTGTAEVTVVYQEDVLVGDVDPAVVSAFEAGLPALDPDLALTYPADGVTVPRNVEGLAFAWSGAAEVSRLRLRSAITDISIFTTEDSWTSTAELFTQIAATNTSGAVEVQVETGQWAGDSLTDLASSQAQELRVNRLDVNGSVFYWATDKESIVRIPFGSSDATVYWPEEEGAGPEGPPCVGCHVVNEAAQSMVVTHDGINGVFTTVEISDVESPYKRYTSDTEERVTFKDVSPDGEYLVGAGNGVLASWYMANGSRVDTYEQLDEWITMPSFHPDGDRLVAVRSPLGQTQSDMVFTGSEIVEIPWADGVIGEPEVLVAADETWNHFYPTWSPDGRWLAFNRAEGSGYANPAAELWILPAGGGSAIALDQANGDDVGNSYPRWAPLPDDSVQWLTFTSTRDYPVLFGDRPNVWVTAVDEEVLAEGFDGSSPAFWLPGQDPDSDNHLAVWWVE